MVRFSQRNPGVKYLMLASEEGLPVTYVGELMDADRAAPLGVILAAASEKIGSEIGWTKPRKIYLSFDDGNVIITDIRGVGTLLMVTDKTLELGLLFDAEVARLTDLITKNVL